MSRQVDRAGCRYGHLVVVSYAGSKHRTAQWRCRCDCGRETVVSGCHLATGHTVSCGRCIGHGHYAGGRPSPTYASWQAMRDRCARRGHPAFSEYGGRGITVCERWTKFENFLADMGVRPAGKTLDRFPNKDGNYEPGNCRWATRCEQQNNRRCNRTLTVGGRTMSVSEWARVCGLGVSTLRQRLQRGWSPESAVSAALGRRP